MPFTPSAYDGLYKRGSSKTDVAKDRVALKGCTFMRIADGPKDSDLAKENGSYDYNKHQICITSSAFKLNQTTFVGTGTSVGPASARTILHEVGHAVELV